MLLRVLCLMCVLIPPGVSAATQNVVLVIGDSLSSGYGMPVTKSWVKLLDKRIADAGLAFSVVNAAEERNTSADALSRLPSLLRQHRPALVVVELGINDGLRGVPLNATRKNLTELTRIAKKTGAKVLLLGTDAPAKMSVKYRDEFKSVHASVAKATGAGIVPSFNATAMADPDLMQADGVHPNSLAQAKLLEAVWPAIESLLKGP